jgi:hypothetical protein
MTNEKIVKRWNELFDENPWLEGMTSDDECGIIVCCPRPEPENWLVLDEVMTLGWLGNLDTSDVLTRNLIDRIGDQNG